MVPKMKHPEASAAAINQQLTWSDGNGDLDAHEVMIYRPMSL
jgi:hypothetical protein